MRICVIGTGSIGKRHLKNCVKLQNELGITEIKCFDPNGDRIKNICKELPEIKAGNSLEESISKVDAVFVCVPTSLHLPVISEI